MSANQADQDRLSLYLTVIATILISAGTAYFVSLIMAPQQSQVLSPVIAVTNYDEILRRLPPNADESDIRRVFSEMKRIERTLSDKGVVVIGEHSVKAAPSSMYIPIPQTVEEILSKYERDSSDE